MKTETKLKDNLQNYMKYYNKRIINITKDCSEWEIESVPKDYDKIGHANEMIYLVRRDSKVKERLQINKFYKSINNGKTSYLYYDGNKVNTVLFLSEYMNEPIGDIWMDISTININKESVVRLTNGKKPESLLRRLLYTFTKSEYMNEPIGDIWMDISTININKESVVRLTNGKKPESLLRRLLYTFTKPDDIVLDAYLGSGTTAAVAHKMGRRYIGIEQLDSHYDMSIERMNNVIKDDIVLDAYLGSGTTAAVAHKMGRRYIGIEQLDSHYDMSIERMNNVINGDQTGISKSVNWEGGGSFIAFELAQNSQKIVDKIINTNDEGELKDIYGDQTGISKSVNWEGGGSFIAFELAQNSQKIVDKIINTNDEGELKDIYDDLINSPFVLYRVAIKAMEKFKYSFDSLNIEDKKKLLVSIIDKNTLYMNYSDIDNEDYNSLTDSDKEFTKNFYRKG